MDSIGQFHGTDHRRRAQHRGRHHAADDAAYLAPRASVAASRPHRRHGPHRHWRGLGSDRQVERPSRLPPMVSPMPSDNHGRSRHMPASASYGMADMRPVSGRHRRGRRLQPRLGVYLRADAGAVARSNGGSGQGHVFDWLHRHSRDMLFLAQIRPRPAYLELSYPDNRRGRRAHPAHAYPLGRIARLAHGPRPERRGTRSRAQIFGPGATLPPAPRQRRRARLRLGARCSTERISRA